MAKLKVLLIVPFAIALFLIFADMTFYGSGKSISNFINLKSTNEIAKFQGIWENADKDTYGRLLAFDATSISLLDDAFYLYEYKATMSRHMLSLETGADDKLDITYQLKGDDLYIWWNDEKPSCYRKIEHTNSIGSMVGELAAEIDLPCVENYGIIDWPENFNLVFDGEKLMVGEQVGELSNLQSMLKKQKGSLNKLTIKRMTVKLFIDKNVKMGDVSVIFNALRNNGLFKVSYMAEPAGKMGNVLLAHTYGRTSLLPPLDEKKLLSDDEIEKMGISIYEIQADNESTTPQSIRPGLKQFIRESDKYVTPLTYKKDTRYSTFLAYNDAVFSVLSELREEYAKQNYNTKFADLSKEQQIAVRHACPANIFLKNLDEPD